MNTNKKIHKAFNSSNSEYFEDNDFNPSLRIERTVFPGEAKRSLTGKGWWFGLQCGELKENKD